MSRTTCPRCMGTKRVATCTSESDVHWIVCPTCDGRGFITPDDTLRGELTLPEDVRRQMRRGCRPTFDGPLVRIALWLTADALIIAGIVLAVRHCAGAR